MRNYDIRGWDLENKEMIYEESMGVILSLIREGSKIIPMLFTGLYDCKKKKIYDGDIVRVDDTLYVVFYSEKEGMVLFVNSMVSISAKNFLNSRVQVVGTIFEVKDVDDSTGWYDRVFEYTYEEFPGGIYRG